MTRLQLRVLASLLYCYERWPGRGYRYTEELQALRHRVREDIKRARRWRLWPQPTHHP